jgi:predicted nucleotidyltransferase
LRIETSKIAEICREHDVATLGLFGSTARGEETEDSDIDLLVQFSKRKSLLAMIALERHLTTALGHKVDLVTEAALSPYMRERIKHDLRVIYAA